MGTLHIDRLEARYRLPPSAARGKSRLDRLLWAVLDHGLDAAKVGRGVGDDELVCLRTLHLPVRLRLAEPDWRLVDAWSQALGRAIEAAICGGDATQVVRYGSRLEALADLAQGIARGDLGRAWAWRAAGLADVAATGSIRTAARALVGALRREPERIMPVLAIVAARGRLAQLASRLDLDLWLGLARAALRSAGADPGIVLAPTIAPTVEPPRTPLPATLARSTIACALVRDAAAAVREPQLTRMLAAFALLEAEPLLLRRADAGASVTWATRFLGSGTFPAGTSQQAGRGPIDGAPRDAPALMARPRGQEDAAGTPPWAADAARRDVPADTSDDAVLAASESQEDGAAPHGLDDLRQAGASVWGGLLFLLHLVDALDLPAALAVGTSFPGRPPRWVLHQLACMLLPLAADDPAALAFAGLRPEDAPPSRGEPPLGEDERQMLAVWRDQIVEGLRARLAWPVDDDPALLRRLCLRRALILADPGWIEVHLRLREVDVDVRRAGLDLDPAYVPWLGVVVTFVYG